MSDAFRNATHVFFLLVVLVVMGFGGANVYAEGENIPGIKRTVN